MTELQWYITVVRRWARLIVVGTVAAAGVGVLVSLIIPKTYTASSQVLILKSRFDVDLDPRAGALSEDDILRLSNFDARRQTLFTLATHPAVLSATLAALPEPYRTDWDIKRLATQGEVETPGSLVQLNVNDHTPAAAAALSQAWATAFVTHVNQLYNQTTPRAALQEQLPLAQVAYEEAQQTLEQFLNSSQLDELKLGVAWREGSLHAAQESYRAAIGSGTTTYLITQQRVPLWLESARTLRAQMAQLPTDTPLPLALESAFFIMQASIANTTQPTPLELQITPTAANLTAGEGVAAVDNLLNALVDWQTRLSGTVAEETAGWLTATDQDPLLADSLATLQAELDELRAQLEAETAQQRELTATRDLRWETYQLLLKQSLESDLLEATPATEVALANLAVIPTDPTSPHIWLNLALGGLLGLTATLVWAFTQAHLTLKAP